MAKFIVGMMGEEAYRTEANDLCEEVRELEASCVISALTRENS